MGVKVKRKVKRRKARVVEHHICYDPEISVKVWDGEHMILERLKWRTHISSGFIAALKIWLAGHQSLGVDLNGSEEEKIWRSVIGFPPLTIATVETKEKDLMLTPYIARVMDGLGSHTYLVPELREGESSDEWLKRCIRVDDRVRR